MIAQIVSIRRSFTPVDLQRAMSATIAAVASEAATEATEVAARQLATMACAFNDVCVALGIIVPPSITEWIDL